MIARVVNRAADVVDAAVLAVGVVALAVYIGAKVLAFAVREGRR